MKKVGLAISGASGVILGYKTMLALTQKGCEVHLVISKDACHTAIYELGKPFCKPEAFVLQLPSSLQSLVHLYDCRNFSSPLASGSFRLDASFIIPCSMATLGAIASGISDNLIRRMADVAIKESWPLVVAPREMPLSAIHLENMLKLARFGVKIAPPIPMWYVSAKTVDDLENQLVGKYLQMIGIEDKVLLKCWSGEHQERLKPEGCKK